MTITIQLYRSDLDLFHSAGQAVHFYWYRHNGFGWLEDGAEEDVDILRQLEQGMRLRPFYLLSLPPPLPSGLTHTHMEGVFGGQ